VPLIRYQIVSILQNRFSLMYKTNFTLFYVLLFTLSIQISCSSDDPEPEQVRTFEDVENDFAAIDLAPGIHDIQLQILNGIEYHFRVIAPERADGENRPMVLALHGATTQPGAEKNTACYVEPGLDTLRAFILSPYGEGGLWFTDFNQEMIGTLMYLTQKYWPVEHDKIAVTGYSNGGNASWLFSKFQSQTLSAAIPMASSYDVYELDGSVAVWDVPLYVIHGENDELFPLAQTQEWVQATADAGTDVTFVIAEDLGHYTPCEYVPYLKQAAIWLKETVWME
jgi:predicted peptidase